MDIQISPAQSTALALQQTEEADRCAICKERLGIPRSDGETEKVFVLPCSHTFGSLCITRWLEHDSLNRDCPHCRRRMVYSGCGHTIRPCDIARAPRCVDEKDMPEMCLVCRGDGVLEEQVRALRERQLAVQRALEGMRVALPGIMGGMCRSTVQNVDRRVADSKDEWRQGVETIYAELERARAEW